MVAAPMTAAERAKRAPDAWESVAGQVAGTVDAAAGAAGSEGFIVASVRLRAAYHTLGGRTRRRQPRFHIFETSGLYRVTCQMRTRAV